MTTNKKSLCRVPALCTLLLAVSITTPIFLFAEDEFAKLDFNLPAAVEAAADEIVAIEVAIEDVFVAEAMAGETADGGTAAEGEAPGTVDVVFDPNPETKADVLAHIEAFEAALLAGDFEAALDAKPRWEHPVDSSLMPKHWFVERVEDDGFGADYYTFFVEIMPLAR